MNYPPAQSKVMLSQILQSLQLGGFITLMFGETICTYLQLAVPDFITQIRSNMMPSFVVFMLIGTISQNLLSTGAFEVEYNGQLIFSKLKSKRWPTMEEIDAIMQQHGLQDYTAAAKVAANNEARVADY